MKKFYAFSSRFHFLGFTGKVEEEGNTSKGYTLLENYTENLGEFDDVIHDFY